MTSPTNHHDRPFRLGAISTLTREDVELVDHLTLDGRCNRIASRPDRIGGLAPYALQAARAVEPGAALALGSLVGAQDRQEVVAKLRPLGLVLDHLMPVPGKRTNRSQVILDPDDRKLIVRREAGIDFEGQLDRRCLASLHGLIARSRACLLGNLSPGLTTDLIEHARSVGTYVMLGAGGQQLDHLASLRAHGLTLNADEVRRATGLGAGTELDEVFRRLLAVSPADRVVAMTGGGRSPTYVADRVRREQWRLDPEDLREYLPADGFLDTLGAGDTFAGVLAFLLGQPPACFPGDAVREAARFAQVVVAAHLTKHPRAIARVSGSYHALRSRPRSGAVVPV